MTITCVASVHPCALQCFEDDNLHATLDSVIRCIVYVCAWCTCMCMFGFATQWNEDMNICICVYSSDYLWLNSDIYVLYVLYVYKSIRDGFDLIILVRLAVCLVKNEQIPVLRDRQLPRLSYEGLVWLSFQFVGFLCTLSWNPQMGCKNTTVGSCQCHEIKRGRIQTLSASYLVRGAIDLLLFI